MNVLKPSHTRRDPGPPELGPLHGSSCLGQFVLGRVLINRDCSAIAECRNDV
jgi:hypothetical protein